MEQSEVGISSLMDTWLLVKAVESDGERNRLLYILKSRGMAHSNQVREFVLSDKGIQLLDVYVGPGQVLTGSSRLMQEAKDTAQLALDRQTGEQRRRDLDHECAALQAEIKSLQGKMGSVQEELKQTEQRDKQRQELLRKERSDLTIARRAD